MENVALWHERDISHSSVERGIGPDATIHLDFALHRMAMVIEKLVVYPDNMARNLALLGGLHNSQRVMLALTQAGVSREDAYRLVQRNAMAVWQSPPPRAASSLIDRLKADAGVTAKLDTKTIDSCFDDAHHFSRVDTIFQRVFG
jgi:adenylosuccinate lyase